MLMKRASGVVLAMMTVVVGCPDEPLVVEPGGVGGVVCNPLTSRIEAQARVTCTYDDELGNSVVRETTTDDNGFFRLGGIGVGSRRIVVQAAAFTSTFDVDVVSRQTVELDDPACRDRPLVPGRGAIAGQVCNRHTGELVTDAEITVVLADGTELSTTTEATNGTFTLDDVPAGTVVVSIVSPDYRKTYVVDVVEGETVVVEQTTDCAVPDPLSTGFVTGKVCAPGTTNEPLAGAHVTIRYTGSDDTSYTDGPFITLDDGSFMIDPIGPTVATNAVVKVEKDDFSYSWNIERINARVDDIDGIDLTADIECQPLQETTDRAYLVVQGQYDRIEDVLDRMGLQNVDLHDGVPITLNWAEALFQTQAIIDGYDVVFINCGVEELELARGLSANAVRNIRRYVEQGGSLYVSDWAYEIIEQAFPEKIDFFGPDDEHDGAQVAIGGDYPTRVVDPELAATVGDTIDIDFQFQLGTVVSQVADDVTIYLEADMQYRKELGGQVIADVLTDTPITVGFRHGLGKVIYTSFHQEQDESLDGPEDAVLRSLVFSL
jgi:hypothetical protein